MPSPTPRFISLAAAALLSMSTLAPAPAQKPAIPQRPAGGTVIFAVEKHEANAQIEPVVILRGGAYVKPPVDESDVTGGNAEAVARRFIGEHFRAGRQFRLLFGGGEDGSVTVVKYIEPGCVGMWAEVRADTSVRLGGEVQALATNSKTIGAGPASRRAPTEAERAAALDLARAAFARNGVTAPLLKKMEVFNLTAADLDRDGKFELVGSFRVENNTEQNFDAHTLFIIYEPDGLGLKPALTWHHRGGEAEYADRRLVDHADLDGDGVSEVIAEGHYYESNDYFIYKKQQGRWRSVYQGGGGGC
ncbi:MAG TPA: hypothetical protein VN228_14620 [Pyrinomonadaceae bacterium]|nr:hypothetical protein [Pyrinomonadaceae bacterium]